MWRGAADAVAADERVPEDADAERVGEHLRQEVGVAEGLGPRVPEDAKDERVPEDAVGGAGDGADAREVVEGVQQEVHLKQGDRGHLYAIATWGAAAIALGRTDGGVLRSYVLSRLANG